MKRMQHVLTRAVLIVVGTVAAPPLPGQTTPTFPDLGSEVRLSSDLTRAAYRRLHENPELGKQETATAAYLTSELRRIGYTEFVPSSRAPTAVIAVLRTGRPGRTIALRAEMDARRTQEPASHDPRSRVPEVMHNCGHDVHAAMLLGAADLLFRNRERLSGTVVFLFQPAEETPGGADDIVAEGILPRLGVQEIYAQHSVAGQPVGTASVSPGPTLAGSNYFTLDVLGRQSHAAQPFTGDDVAAAAARIAAALTDYPARHTDVVNRPMVVSVTYIGAGTEAQSNVLPDSARIRGTIRAFEDIGSPPAGGGEPLTAALQRYVASLGQALGVRVTLHIRYGSPPTVNDTTLFKRVAEPLRRVWPGTLDTTPYRGLFAEDFAYYTASIPSLYFGIGIARDGLGLANVHTPDFTIHPAALDEGVRLLALLAELGTAGTRADGAAPPTR